MDRNLRTIVSFKLPLKLQDNYISYCYFVIIDLENKALQKDI